MKCLTVKDAAEWFRPLGVSISRDHSLLFPTILDRTSYLKTAGFPCDANRLTYFAWGLAEWLPSHGSRMLWLGDWNTYPLGNYMFFEKLRNGWGETRRIIDTPGHLFSAFAGAKDSFYDHEDNAMLSGLILLVLCFDWQAYLIPQHSLDHIIMGDNFVAFFSENEHRLRAAATLMSSFGLRNA